MIIRSHLLWLLLLLALALLSVGCASRGGTATRARETRPADASCFLTHGRPEPGGAITIALTDSVTPRHAPEGRNPSERMLFRHLYETLVEVDCNGRVEPGLAGSWTSADSGRVWIFTLRPEARFWNGSPVTAADVAWSWTTTQMTNVEKSRFSWLDPRSVMTLDDRHLVVSLAMPQSDPAVFADPTLAVVHRFDADALPMGTGRFRFTGEIEELTRDLECLPNPNHLDPPAAAERLVFQFRPNADPRDLHGEGGADAFLVRDRAQLRYLESVEGFARIPMEWERVYLVLSPMGMAGWTPTWSRQELALEVTASDARPAQSILFEHFESAGEPEEPHEARAARDASNESPRQGQTAEAAPLSGRPVQSRIVYLAEDRDAKGIAERVTALIGSSLPEPALGPIAVGLAAVDFERALNGGSEAAYVLGMRYRHADPRLQLVELVHAAPWIMQTLRTTSGIPASIDLIASAPPEGLAAELVTAGIAFPLLVTRPHLVARRGLAGIIAGEAGSPRFDRAGWTKHGNENGSATQSPETTRP